MMVHGARGFDILSVLSFRLPPYGGKDEDSYGAT
jgi:hypothetical protein